MGFYTATANKTTSCTIHGINSDVVYIDAAVDPDLRIATAVYCPSITVPNSSTIANAYIDFTKLGQGFGAAIEATVTAEDVDNSVAPLCPYNTIFGRPRTAASSTWMADETQTRTTDIKEPIQEVVNRPGWASGNSMMLFFESNQTTGNFHNWGEQNIYTFRLYIAFS